MMFNDLLHYAMEEKNNESFSSFHLYLSWDLIICLGLGNSHMVLFSFVSHLGSDLLFRHRQLSHGVVFLRISVGI